MQRKGVKKVVETMILALMLMLLLADHSSMAATVDHGSADDQCIQKCMLACPKYENCDLTCPVRCAVRQPTPLPYNGNFDAYCKLSCSVAPHCIRFHHDKNRKRRCIAECGRTCMANEGSDF